MGKGQRGHAPAGQRWQVPHLATVVRLALWVPPSEAKCAKAGEDEVGQALPDQKVGEDTGARGSHPGLLGMSLSQNEPTENSSV